MKIEIKPSFPTYPVILTIFFLGIGCWILTNPFLFTNLKIAAAAVFSFSIGIFPIYLIEDRYRKLEINNEHISLTGFFCLKKVRYKVSDVAGYELHQRVHPHLGLHNEIKLSLTNGKKINFQKEAYSDYDKLEETIAVNFKLLEFRPIKHALVFSILIPILFAVSAILACILGVMKLLK